MNQEQLNKILEYHKKWLSGNGGQRANLERADLLGANLSGADLSRANLYGANLSGADLSGAYLLGADLFRANLYGANLSGANLSGADLSGAYLLGAKNFNPWKWSILPEEGSFTMFKQVKDKQYNKFVILLAVHAQAERCHCIGERKVRASKVKVMKIYDLDHNEIKDKDLELFSPTHSVKLMYKLGEEISTKFVTNWTESCTEGIHGFLSFEEARDY